MKKDAARISAADLRWNTLIAFEGRMQECGARPFWHWGEPPTLNIGQPLKPTDLPFEAPSRLESDRCLDVPALKWTPVGTLNGYWLAPGERPRVVSQIDLFRNSIQGLPEIRGRVKSLPFQCQVLIDGKAEPFFGETWSVEFPQIPIIAEDLPLDHPLRGLNDRFIQKDDPATLAIIANQRAAELRNKPVHDICEWTLNRMYAEQAEAESRRLLEIGDRDIVHGPGETIVPIESEEFSLADTLANPTMISVNASSQRLNLLRKAGVLPSGIDAAETAGVKDSLSKMLAHQLAAAHRSAMELLQQGRVSGVPNLDAMRTLGTAARMMLTYQSGLETLHRIRTGTRQTVVVKHIQITQVSDGGKAVIASKVKGGNRGAARKSRGF